MDAFMLAQVPVFSSISPLVHSSGHSALGLMPSTVTSMNLSILINIMPPRYPHRTMQYRQSLTEALFLDGSSCVSLILKPSIMELTQEKLVPFVEAMPSEAT